MTGRRHSGRVLLRPFLFVVVAIVCGVVPATAVLGAAAPSVSIRLFHGAAVHYPVGIAAGADGALWFTNEEGHSIGRISVQGTLGEYTDPRIAAPSAIASGPDGALWFLNGGGSFGRITTAGVVTTYTTDAIASTVGLAAGPDGAMWFTTGAKSVGRLAMDGTVTTFVDPARMRGTYGIVAGPDGALWFTNYLGGSIGRISVDGVVTEYSDPRIRFPLGITAGPDGALWFADDSGSIGRITTTGAVSTFGDPSTVGHPFAITVGADRALWLTERGGSIVRITPSGAISRYADPSVQVPVGIASGPDGALWFTDYTANAIGRVVLQKPAPRLTAAASTVVRSRALVTVRVHVRVDSAALLTLTARDPRTGRSLRLEAGSKVAGTVLRRPATAVRGARLEARAFIVEAVLSTARLMRGRAYELVLGAVGTAGSRSDVTIAFRG